MAHLIKLLLLFGLFTVITADSMIENKTCNYDETVKDILVQCDHQINCVLEHIITNYNELSIRQNKFKNDILFSMHYHQEKFSQYISFAIVLLVIFFFFGIIIIDKTFSIIDNKFNDINKDIKKMNNKLLEH